MRNRIVNLIVALLGHRFAGAVELPNIAEGTHVEGKINKLCDAAITQEHAVVKTGSDADHVVVTAANTDQPLGLAYQLTDAAEDGVGVQLFGKGAGTKLAPAGAAIAREARVVPSADGKLETLPTDAGTYWVVGIAETAAAADEDLFELNDCVPYPVVVT